MVRPMFLAASEKRLTMCFKAFSVWARKVQSSANSSSVMISSMVLVRARRPIHLCSTSLWFLKIFHSQQTMVNNDIRIYCVSKLYRTVVVHLGYFSCKCWMG